MSADYLDLLLDRTTGIIPVAEPRIGTTLAGQTQAVWEEINEEVPRHSAPSRMDYSGYPPPTAIPSQPPAPSHSAADASQHRETPPPQYLIEQIETPGRPLDRPPTATIIQPPTPSIVAIDEQHQASHSNDRPTSHLLYSATRDKSSAPESNISQTPQAQRWFPSHPPTLEPISKPGPPLATPTPHQSQPPAPISIRIDRIEVRAGGPALRPAPVPRPHAPAPLGLDEYLKRKSEGAR